MSVKRPIYFYLLITTLCPVIIASSFKPDWGFFGHRKINRMAVFTLPEEMLPLFKKQISYLEEHAVDPDKRRYATKFEAIRHYIDIDAWGTYPYPDLPRDFSEAIMVKAHYLLIHHASHDTTTMTVIPEGENMHWMIDKDTVMTVSKKHAVYFSSHFLRPQYYEEKWTVPLDSFDSVFGSKSPYLSLKYDELVVQDKLSEHGILPYYLEQAVFKLTKAFESKNSSDILRNAADIGHYIGDAHVPLHTTRNYNGQLSDQVGIHAFWESRLPELFSEASYDFFAGKADYISDLRPYFWNIVLESNSHLDSVLSIEKRLSKEFPSDRQWCYDERLDQTVRIQCKEFSEAYHIAMDGMVEDRMTKAIHAVGSIWYTAWVNAGQPDLGNLNFIPVPEAPIIIDESLKVRDEN